MAKALLTALLLVCALFSFDTSDACASGFISNDIERQLSNVTQYPQGQYIFPEINFVGCNGSVTAWTIGARWRADENRTLFPHLQIWRRTEADTYTSVNATELFVPGGTERAFSRYVFNGSIDPPLEFQDGDIIGVFQPRFDRSRIRLLRVSGNTLNYYIRTVDAVTEPPMIPFTADNDSLNSDSSQPALTVEIRIDCSPLDDPINGAVSITNDANGIMVASYNCSEGYEPMGNTSRDCQPDGQWSGMETVCEVVDCGHLPNPINGIVMTNGTTFKSMAKYNCSENFQLVGEQSRTCQASGVWSGDQPVCEVAETQEPSPQSGKQNIAGLAAGVAGGVVGGTLLLIIGAVIVVLLLQRQKLKQKYDLPASEEHNLQNPLYGNIGDDSAHDERYSEVTGLNVSAPEGKKYENGVHHTDHELQRLSESVEASHVFDNPVYTDSGPIAFCQSELYESSPGGPVEVAVKTLNDGASEQDRVKFLQEAAISGQFHHPNVIKLHGVITVREPTMIVLEFMSKGDLRTYLNEEKPCPGEACPPEMPKLCLEFCRQIASGMEYLSKKAFVHRDLAARNVLVSQRKTCKIADFGMARDLEDENYYSSQGAGKIPVKWTAPEALNFKKFSTASDVWSFGAVMYEIWSLGHKPFEGYTTQQTLHCINEGYRLSPPPGCSKAIYSTMIRCWHPEASSRPTFADLQQVLSDTDNLLSWSEEDTKVHPQAAVLGAPLDAGKDLYPEVQGTYMY